MENSNIGYHVTAICGPADSALTLDSYQCYAVGTADCSESYHIIYPTLGLSGEAGEVVEKVKKVIRDHNGDFSPVLCEEIALEIGDVLWNCAVLAHHIGYRLETIARMNQRKINRRLSNGTLHCNGDER